MFEEIRWILDNVFGISGSGFVIRKNVSPENIETCNGNFILNGKRDHAGEKFNCHVGCVAWPFGKIKIATPLLKD